MEVSLVVVIVLCIPGFGAALVVIVGMVGGMVLRIARSLSMPVV